MPLLPVILTLLIVGVLLFVINTYGVLVVDLKILRIINFVVILVVILWLLKLFGVYAYLSGVRL
jgi:hypothetical protein